MKYTLGDFVQMAVGTFSATLLFVSIRAGQPGPFLDARVGGVIALLWTFLLYKSFMHNNHTSITKFVINVGIAWFISIFMAISFQLATMAQVSGLNFFSSPALIVYLLGLPIGLLFEKKNIKSVLSRHYISKKN